MIYGGFIDKTGKEVIKFIYSEVLFFVDGYAIVANSNGLYGVIDKTGEEVVPCRYKHIAYKSSRYYF